jgi:hypothetical protein
MLMLARVIRTAPPTHIAGRTPFLHTRETKLPPSSPRLSREIHKMRRDDHEGITYSHRVGSFGWVFFDPKQND